MQQLRAGPPMMALPRAKQNSVGPADWPTAVDVLWAQAEAGGKR